MSESKSLVKLQNLLLMSDSDMAAAAQQLMQLSDEDSSSCSSYSNDDNNKKIKEKMNIQRVFEQSQDEITSAKIEEIFGKEEEILRPVKQRRYRFLASVYKETKPIKVSYGKNSWY
ncbi:hypothetical protein DITRI_Ditri18aG0048300 [Diplodiscus trichospermus]